MPSKNPLEKQIINTIIRYAYALRKDEEAALLSAFLVISYHTHREAVESMLPDNNYEQFMSAHMPATDAPSVVLMQDTSSVDAVTGQAYHESMITKHLHSFRHLFRRREIVLQEEEELALFRTIQGVADQVNREAVESMLPDKNYEQFISVHMPATDAAPLVLLRDALAVDAVTGKAYHESMITRHLQSFRHLFRSRESVLQEEEELALFGTIQGVADQVNREAIESEIRYGIGSQWSIGMASERAGEGPWGNIGVPVADLIAARESKNNKAKKTGYPMDTYIDFMDEELKITRGIIDRNRALSQGYLNAKAM